DIDQKHMVLAIFHQLTQSRLELGAAPARQPALENGKLNPLAIAMHGFEHPSPAPLVGNVVGDVRLVDPIARTAKEVSLEEAKALSSGEALLVTRRLGG